MDPIDDVMDAIEQQKIKSRRRRRLKKSKAGNQWGLEIISPNDRKNIQVLFQQILPLMGFERDITSTTTQSIRLQRGTSGAGFMLRRRTLDAENQRLFLKLFRPVFVRKERERNKRDWRSTNFYQEHFVLQKYGMDQPSPFIIKYHGMVDLTGMRAKDFLYTPSLFDQRDQRRLYQIIQREIQPALQFPSNIFALFTESLDQDMMGRTVVDLLALIVFTFDISLGLAHFHQRGDVHCDIKPSNIMKLHLPRIGRVYKIIDLGAVSPKGGYQQTHTPQYVDPDFQEKKLDDGKRDVFALGLTILRRVGASDVALDDVQAGDPGRTATVVDQSVDRVQNKYGANARRFKALLVHMLEPRRVNRFTAFQCAMECLECFPRQWLRQLIDRCEDIYRHYHIQPDDQVFLMLSKARQHTFKTGSQSW